MRQLQPDIVMTAALAAYGFQLESTGGDCTAFILTNELGVETYITDGDHRAPVYFDSYCEVEVHDTFGNTVHYSEWDTVREFMEHENML